MNWLRGWRTKQPPCPTSRRHTCHQKGEDCATTAKGGPRPPLAESRSKRRHRQRRCRSLRRQGSEQGAARNERGAARANNLKQLNSTPFFYNCLCSFSHSGLTDILCYIGLSFLTLDLPTRSDISVEVACRQAQHSASMKKVVIRFH